MTSPPLEPLAPGLWVASRPLRLWLGDVGTRMREGFVFLGPR